ncbi:MAG TPA: class I SAM-dependent methyltransferase [Syntrophales bacterium]|nr:class I SAM-dependent methyltransferase [Syntrophales bacterium]
MAAERIFDDWPDRYDRWFETPIGRLVRAFEGELVLEMLAPRPGERILDVGCGTGIFTADILARGASVVGLDISLPMLRRAQRRAGTAPFAAVAGDMARLPMADSSFDRVASITAIEFFRDGAAAVAELFRVARPGAVIVVASLNRLSPWAERRKAQGQSGEKPIFRGAVFRSPAELLACAPVPGEARTAIHFLKDEDPERAGALEAQGRAERRETGAFVAVRWVKP